VNALTAAPTARIRRAPPLISTSTGRLLTAGLRALLAGPLLATSLVTLQSVGRA
jgi:hypothetical protein